MKLHTSFTLYI